MEKKLRREESTAPVDWAAMRALLEIGWGRHLAHLAEPSPALDGAGTHHSASPPPRKPSGPKAAPRPRARR